MIDPHNQHKKAVPGVVREVIRISDVILEILDSRFLDETRNPEIETVMKELNKRVVYVLNKADLRDIDELKAEAEKKKLFPYVVVSCKNKIGKGHLIERIKIEARRVLSEKKYKIAHVGVIGYPNAGKSSLINYLTGRNVAATSPEAGFTKGMKKIRLSKGILLLDTPGVIPEKESASRSLNDLQKHSKINAKTLSKIKDPELTVDGLMKGNPGLFEKHYKIDANGDSEKLIEELGRRSHLLLTGNRVNMDRVARKIIQEWQEGKIKKDE